MSRGRTKTVEFSDQQFLMDFIHFFPNTVHNPKAKQEKTADFIPTRYNHFIQLTGQPGADVNRMIMSPFSSKLEFNNFSSAHLSLLVPQIKIFIVLQEGARVQEVQLPISAVTTLDSITKSKEGRGTDVSLESVSWVEQALHPEGQGDVTGKIKLHFQSLEGVFLQRGSTLGKDWGYYNLLHASQARNSYLTRMESRVNDANPRWPMKIVVGYSVPDDPNRSIFNQDQIDIVHSLKHTMTVQSHKYSIDLTESGEVTLTIDFMGNLDSKGSSGIKYDLFLASEMSPKHQIIRSETDRLIRLEKETKKFMSNDTELRSEADQQAAKESHYGVQQKLLGLQSLAAKDAYTQLFNIIDNLRLGKTGAKEPMSKLQTKKDDRAGGRLFYMDLSAKAIAAYVELKKLSTTTIDQSGDKKKKKKPLTSDQLKDAQKLKKEKMRELYKQITDSTKPTGRHQTGIRKGSKEMDPASDPVAAAQARLNSVGEAKKDRDDFSSKWGKHYESDKIKLTKQGGHRVNFFFLGDLIEAACKIIHDRPELKAGCPPSFSGKQSQFQKEMWKQVRVILGTIRLRNPADKLKDKNKILNICLADIPISFNAFQVFWNQEVWAKSRLNYPLPEFLLNVCNVLIPAAVQGCVYGGRVAGLSEKANLYKYRLPAKDVLDEVWKRGQAKRITLEQITEKRWEGPDQGSTSDYEEYIHLQGAIAAPQFFTKAGQKWNLAETTTYNNKHGIPTLYIGNNRGLLKKVSFQRTKTPASLMMENIARNADASGANLLMADLYSISAEMFGNPILMNGMYVYLNPRSLGLPDEIPESIAGKKNPMQWASEIGLGGYYLIGKVQHRIDKRGYFTTFTGVPDNVQVGFETPANEPQKKSEDNVSRNI